jgi:hypothetical protein
VTRFFETADHYQKTFRNLTVEETKVIEELDRARVRKRREIVADLVVYQSAREGSGTTEYRDVRSVDGKPVDRRGNRTLDLITQAANATKLEEELRLINEESQRYDQGRYVRGFAIQQVAAGAAPDDFSFEWAGREQVNGHDTVVLNYRTATGGVMDPRSARAYEAMGITLFQVQGRLWLDSATFQLRRQQWRLTGFQVFLKQQVDLVIADGTFTDSRFGILVPERFVFSWYEMVREPRARRTAKPVFALAARTTFTYGTFRRFEVATEENLQKP